MNPRPSEWIMAVRVRIRAWSMATWTTAMTVPRLRRRPPEASFAADWRQKPRDARSQKLSDGALPTFTPTAYSSH